MAEFLTGLLVFVLLCWLSFIVLTFICEVPIQLKRIADAIEWRNKNGK